MNFESVHDEHERMISECRDELVNALSIAMPGTCFDPSLVASAVDNLIRARLLAQSFRNQTDAETKRDAYEARAEQERSEDT